MRILIVDDRPLGARKLRDDILATEPSYQVEVAATADETLAADHAKQIVREARERFDVFLIDDNMGAGPNGSELMIELAQLSPSSEAIIFTAYADEVGKRRAIEGGARAYVPRPVNEKELLWQLRGIQKDQSTRRERDWLQLLAATTTKELQEATSIQDAGQAIVKGAQQLGFQRARLRIVCGGQGEQIEMIGVSQIGSDGPTDDFTSIKRSLKDLPYSRKVMCETKNPTLFHGRELGRAPWDEYITPPRDEWFKVPLFVGDKPIGSLSLDNGAEPCKYTSDDRQKLEQLLDLFGKQAAAALERAKFQEQVVVLSDIGRVVTTKAAQGNPDALLEEVRQQVKRLMDVSNFMVVMTDPDSDLLDFRLNYEGDEPLLRQWRDPEQGLAGYLIQENKPLWLPNATEAAFREQHQIPPCGQMSQCWLGVPLHVDEHRAIGALVVQHYENPQQYNEDQLRLLEAVAKQIAGAIDLVVQRERESAIHRRPEFINEVRGRLPDILQEKEDWFWALLLKFISDECGLRFNRAAVFLAEDDHSRLRGRSGVGQLHEVDALRAWGELAQQRQLDAAQRCDLDRFINHLRSVQPIDRTPIEQEAPNWTLSVADGPLRRIRETGKPESIPLDQLPDLPEALCAGLREKSVECVAAPLITNGRFLGIILADNAFSNEPVRQEVLTSMAEILNYAAILWERAEAKRRELTSAQREQLASVRAQVLRAIQSANLQERLQLLCRKAQDMLEANSVVIYPLADDGVAFLIGQIAQVGLDPVKAKKHFANRPRQHGSFAYVKRVGEVIIPDVTKSDLRFLDPQGFEQPLQQHSFIRDHEIRAFIGLALRSRDTGDPLGVMYLNADAPRHFTDQEKVVAVELAEIAVLAISTARGSKEIVDQQRTQGLNRMRDVLEAALSPDADDTKVISALLANTIALLPATKSVKLGLLRFRDGQPLEDGSWLVYRNVRRDLPNFPLREKISFSKIAERAFKDKELISVHGQEPETIVALAAPVYHNKQVVGVLQVTSSQGDDFNDQDKVRLAEFASTAGLVIGSLWRRQGLLRAVLKAAEQVTRSSSLQETLKAIVDQSHEAVPEVECVTLWHRRPGADKLIVGPFRGVNKPEHQAGEETESSLVRAIMARTDSVWASDVKEHPLFIGHDFINAENIVSTAAFPLWDGKESVGSLFFNYRKYHAFTDEERSAFPIFAAIAAATIQDAQLIETAERARERLEIAASVSAAVGTSLDLPTVLERIVDELHDRFKHQGRDPIPYVMLFDSHVKALIFAPSATKYYVIDNPNHQGMTQLPLGLNIKSISLQVARETCEALESHEKKSIVKCVNNVAAEGYERFRLDTNAELCAGLVSDGRFLGVLVLKSSQVGAFSEEDMQLFKLVAEQVALAIDRAERAALARRNATVAGAMAWAADVAHDINPEVYYICSRLEWLHSPEYCMTASGIELVDDINSRAKQLADTARDAISARSHPEPFVLGEMLREKTRKWRPRSAPNVTILIEEDEQIQLTAYREQIWRAVRQLLKNAVEEMDYKGFITIRLYRIKGKGVSMQIADSGCGVPETVGQRLFREPCSTKNKPEGGFGLLISQWLIQSMGGNIRLLPHELGHGAKFEITLPIDKAANLEVSHVSNTL